MTYPYVWVSLDFDADAWDAAATWTDVTDYVCGPVDVSWGRSSALDEFQPGTGRAVLRNDDGRFDPENTGGPYYGKLTPRRRIKVEAGFDVINDDFEDASIGADWSTFGVGTVAEAGDSLDITTSTAGGSTGVIAQSSPFFAGPSSYECHFEAASFTGDSFVAFPLHLVFDVGSGYEVARWQVDNSTIRAQRIVGGSSTDVWTDTYSTTTHAWVRVRGSRTSGETIWETSEDGASWTERYRETVATFTATPEWTISTYSGAEASTVTLQVEDARLRSLYPLSYGWVSGWPQRQDFRHVGRVDLEWRDALSVLNRVEMPNSVWEYLIRETRSPYMWYRLDGVTSDVEDASGNDRHAEWRSFQGVELPWESDVVLPDSIVEQGTIDKLVPKSNRGAKNFAEMQAEVTQPYGLSVPPGVPRVPCIIGPRNFVLSNNTFTFECWIAFRQAFKLNVNNLTDAATTVWQPIVTWGDEATGPYLEFGITDEGKAYFLANELWGDDFAGGTYTVNAIDPSEPVHHLMWFSEIDGSGDWVIWMAVDGVLEVGGTLSATAQVNVPVQWPLVVNRAAGNLSWRSIQDRSLQSTIAELVFYDTTLTFSGANDDAEKSWAAGRYGSLDPAVTELSAGDVITQSLEMLGWGLPTTINTGGSIVDPAVPARAKALKYLRDTARSELGALYQAPDGRLTYLGPFWTVSEARAKASQYTLSDDGSSSYSYSSLDFDYDDRRVVNEVLVRWPGGEQQASDSTSITTYGRSTETLDTVLASANDALNLAQRVVYLRKDPQRRVSHPVEIEPVTQADFEMALDLEFATRLTLKRTTPDDRAVSDDYWVQGIRHRISPGQGEWRTSVTLDLADAPARWFTCNSSELNGSDVLA